MAVVSISLPDELTTQLDHAIRDGEYQGRSQFLRAALRHYIQDRTTVQTGHVHGSITMIYRHGNEPRISDIRHAFHDVVLSMMHTHCEEEVCMDVLIVGGQAHRIQELADTLERMREVERSRLVPVG